MWFIYGFLCLPASRRSNKKALSLVVKIPAVRDHLALLGIVLLEVTLPVDRFLLFLEPGLFQRRGPVSVPVEVSLLHQGAQRKGLAGVDAHDNHRARVHLLVDLGLQVLAAPARTEIPM